MPGGLRARLCRAFLVLIIVVIYCIYTRSSIFVVYARGRVLAFRQLGSDEAALSLSRCNSPDKSALGRLISRSYFFFLVFTFSLASFVHACLSF